MEEKKQNVEVEEKEGTPFLTPLGEKKTMQKKKNTPENAGNNSHQPKDDDPNKQGMLGV